MENSQMMEMFKLFNEYIETQLDKRIEELGLVQEDSYHSKETGELAAAMAKAQADYPVAIYKNKMNPFFKSSYSDLDNTLSQIRPILARNGIFFEQFTVIDKDSGARTLHSRITHSSGQFTESRERITPAKGDSQSYGSELSYKRRYQGESLLGITISDEDDDGEANMQEARKKEVAGTAINANVNVHKQAYATLNAFQHAQLNESLKGYPDLYEGILEAYKVSSLADLPQDKYDLVITRVRKNIESRKKGSEPIEK